MPFLGPKDILSTMGSTSKRYRGIAESDELWQTFCHWRGSEASKTLKEMIRYHASVSGALQTVPVSDGQVGRDGVRIQLRDMLDAFQQASESPNALESYKMLHREHPLNIANFSLFLLRSPPQWCARRGCYKFATLRCDWPLCIHRTCRTHRFIAAQQNYTGLLRPGLTSASTVMTCKWCRLQVCKKSCQAQGASKVFTYCDCCDTAACIDCRNIVGIFTTKQCDECNIRCCFQCSWKLKEDADSEERRVVQPVVSARELEDLQARTKKTFCSRRCGECFVEKNKSSKPPAKRQRGV